MIAVIEGPDGAGKTTLANRLEEYGFDYLHFSQPERTPIEEYTHPMTQDDWLVIDRFHLGEHVYGPLYRGISLLASHQSLYVDMYLESRGAVLVLKTADVDTLIQRCEKRGEDYLRMMDMPRVVREFWTQFELSHMSKRLVNPAARDVADLCAQQMVNWRVMRNFPYYVGRRYPTTLLVGDEPGTTEPRILHVPFVPVPGSSGDYLWRVLNHTATWQIGVTNSRLADGTDVPLDKLWKALKEPKVVALGQKADTRLSHFDIPHGVVPHPQYIRRFKNSFVDAYRVAILEAAFTNQVVTDFAA